MKRGCILYFVGIIVLSLCIESGLSGIIALIFIVLTCLFTYFFRKVSDKAKEETDSEMIERIFGKQDSKKMDSNEVEFWIKKDNNEFIATNEKMEIHISCFNDHNSLDFIKKTYGVYHAEISNHILGVSRIVENIERSKLQREIEQIFQEWDKDENQNRNKSVSEHLDIAPNVTPEEVKKEYSDTTITSNTNKEGSKNLDNLIGLETVKESDDDLDDDNELYDDEYLDEEDRDDDNVEMDDDFYKSMYDEYDQIEADDVLVSSGKFRAMADVLKDTHDFIEDICYEKEFQAYIGKISSGKDDINTASSLFSSLKFFIMKDILRNYDELGHSYYFIGPVSGNKVYTLNMDEAEGQYLHEIVALMMSYDEDEDYKYEEYRKELRGKKGRYKDIRAIREEALETYAKADVKASASDGHDDFQMCMILHNYNEDYEQKYRTLMYRIASLIAKVDDTVTFEESEYLESIMSECRRDTNADSAENEDDKLFPIPDKTLDELIGLDEVKKSVHTLTNFIKVNKKRGEIGMKVPNVSYHCVFSGNPGTGKTTVARILAGIYKDLGVLKKGHLVETDRSGLVAEYVGQTAVKTNKIIDNALDGVLFIDEAYSLVQGGSEDYGSEAIATLLKRMEDDRDRLVVILAGYTNEMEEFINSNPGLRSRFNRYIHFEDYTAEELYKIFLLNAEKNEYTLADDVKEYLLKKLEDVVANKPKDFGNARYIRNLFEKTVEAQANRLASEPKITKELLVEIKKEDIMCDMRI